MYFVNHGLNGTAVKVYVGDGGEQAGEHGLIRIRSGNIPAGNGACQTDKCAGQLILKLCHICSLSADTCLTCTAGASGCLFTLKTKHIAHFFIFPFVPLWQSSD